MNANSAHVADHYARMQIQTASRQKKICMLHDRCCELIMSASSRSVGDRRVHLNKAQNILARLQSALRIEDDVSQSLFYLYDYAYVLLERGAPEDVSHALDVVEPLRQTFRELV